jgi:YD repeat-containing protein
LEIRRWNFVDGAPSEPVENPVEVTSFVYDDATNLSRRIDASGTVFETRLDGLNRPLRSTAAVGTPEQITFDYSYAASGLRTIQKRTPAPTASGSFITELVQSNRGPLLDVLEQGKPLLHRELDAYGRIVQQLERTQGTRRYDYNAYGNVISVSRIGPGDVAKPYASFDWNSDGALKLAVDGAGHQTTRSYDALGRLKSITNGLGVTTYEYMPGSRWPIQISSRPECTQTNMISPGA